MEQEIRFMTEKRLVPFWGRVMVLPSPVDQHQLSSGIVIPISETTDLTRGVVVALDECYDDAPPSAYKFSELIPPGTIIYFRGGVKLGDYYLLQGENIYAREETR